MASRVAGAVLALIAAALLAVSVIAAPWWAGHPKFNGAEIKAKEIAVGPLGARGCNTGGDGACMNVPVDPTFETIGYALVGVTGLLAIVALVLAAMTAKGAAKRKSFAVFAIVGSMIAALLAVLLVVVGPKIRTEAPLPFSTGLFIFFGGVTCALAASVFAMRVREAATSRMQLAPPRPSAQSMHPAAVSPGGGFDVQALLADDAAVRPSQPAMNRNAPVASPGGALPGPSGPLGSLSGPQQPLFSSAPQLRPLYDVAPGQGGTGGFVPQRPTNMPTRPPTPIPRDQVAAHAGIPTPASIEAQRPATMAGLSIPRPPSDATDRDLLGTARGAGKPKTLPPPNRTKSPSMPPMAVPQPLQLPTPPAPTPLPPPPPPKTLAAMAVPPPPNTTLATPPSSESVDEPFDAMKTYQKEPAPKAAPKPRPSVPMPAKPAKPAAPPPRAPTPRPPTRLLTEDAAVDTDVSQQAIDDASPPTESFETATNESTSFAQKPQKPVTSTMETQPAPADSVDEDALTVGRDKVSITDMVPAVRPPTETSPSTPPAPDVPDHEKPTERAADHEKPTERAPADHEKPTERAPTKVPISTAPDSLPPPTEKQAAASGPSPACPQCEAPMAWVEAHLRFYCKSCKMYF